MYAQFLLHATTIHDKNCFFEYNNVKTTVFWDITGGQ
jgi:hypothetical protein